MSRIEKTVFICYRRLNVSWALFIYQYLTAHGFDVFFDYLSIDSGNFESVIIENIKARAHFLAILTPSALDRCDEPGDWMRREIETALEHKRNIIPLMVESFDFGSPNVKKALTGKLSHLSQLNGLRIPSDYAFEAMKRLETRHLNVSLKDVHLPKLQESVKEITRGQQEAADQAEPVKEQQLTAQEWFERAYVFQQNRNYDEALRCYHEFITLETYSHNSAMAFNNIGNMYRDQGKLEEAIAAYEKAIALDPKYTYPRNGLGNAYRDQGKQDEAIAAYEKAIALDPKHADPWNGLGNAYSHQGKLEEAIAAYEEAIALDPKFAYPWNGLGNTYRDQGKLEEAIAAYEEAIAIDPKYTSPWNSLGNVYDDQGKQEEAITAYEKAIALDPKFAYPWHGLGNVYVNQGKLEKAIAVYEKAIVLDSKIFFAHASLANCYRTLGHENDYQKNINQARTNIENASIYNQACFYAICGDVEQSLMLLKKGIAERPGLLIWARNDPDFESIRDDPRFRELVGLA